MRRTMSGGLLGVMLMACSDPSGPRLSDQEHLVLQVIQGLDWRVLPDDGATITAARVEGQTLFLTVRFGGGCASHQFALVAGTDLAESSPPYTVFRLAHDGNGDPCDALLVRNLEVNLAPIIPLVQQSGAAALRFNLVEPGEQLSAVGELLLTF